jgi:hypothetical protein
MMHSSGVYQRLCGGDGDWQQQLLLFVLLQYYFHRQPHQPSRVNQQNVPTTPSLLPRHLMSMGGSYWLTCHAEALHSHQEWQLLLSTRKVHYRSFEVSWPHLS